MPGLSDSPSDDELLAAGDPQSFAAFYRRHVNWVLGYLQRRTRNPELAADLTAEVFAAALLGRRRYRPRDGHANSRLFRIALNKLADSQRRG
jgi:RNA polymerase sigma-70 factor (ECF subfamily)